MYMVYETKCPISEKQDAIVTHHDPVGVILGHRAIQWTNSKDNELHK